MHPDDSRIDEELAVPDRRSAHGLPEAEAVPGPVVVELNLRHQSGPAGAARAFFAEYGRLGLAGRAEPVLISTGYVRAMLSITEVRTLLARDDEGGPTRRAIFRVWPDYLLKPLIDASASTVKALPARSAFDAAGSGITWAVVDSGIDAGHPHFATYGTLGPPADSWHRDFTGGCRDDSRGTALEDGFGHGTHVAGILAGGLPPGGPARHRVVEHASLRSRMGAFGAEIDLTDVHKHRDQLDRFTEHEPLIIREVARADLLTGIAPLTRLVSLKVLDGDGNGRSSDAIRALRFVREVANGGQALGIQGVNMSLGYEFNSRAFAAGHSPLCSEVNRLVASGVVVIAAAGNTGFGEVSARSGLANAPLLATINDPGNAARAITVGAAHRTAPHSYGVSFFSSKGPTGDGRLKPDLVAPGERITSCAAGRNLAKVLRALGEAAVAGAGYYLDADGTSMAAPHVSGAAAAFLSVHPEFVGRPEEVKRVLTASATSLGREAAFQGHGLLDVLRAVQSV